MLWICRSEIGGMEVDSEVVRVEWRSMSGRYRAVHNGQDMPEIVFNLKKYKTMKEIRVYVVNCDKYEGCEDLQAISNLRFIEIAEEQGTVYSLKGFETDVNEDWLGLDNAYIRFIEVECAESINFEEWNIPMVKLNE